MKNPYAVALAKKAVRARMRKVSPERRREIARQAALARWRKEQP